MALIDFDKIPEIKRVFVGRKHELKLFEDAAHAIPEDRCGLLVFHGLGGRGKTWLCGKIRDTCRDDPNYNALIIGYLDLHSKPDAAKRDDLMALVYVRNAFAEQKISFPVFDLALALAWEANRPEEPFPKLKNPWLRRTTGAADDLIAEGAGDVKDWLSSENVASVIGDEIGKVPLVGTLLARGGRWMISKAKLAWLHMAHDDLKRLFLPDSRQLKAPEKLQRLLPYMLAVDLNRAAKEEPGRRLALLIDEYERVFEQGGSGDGLVENRFDAAIRALLEYSEGLLGVFFGRERLPPWRAGDPITEMLDGNQHELMGLSCEEADDYLRAVSVHDGALRAAIIEGALEAENSVYPLMLELQVEHWAALTGAGRQPQPDDFRFDGEAIQPRLQKMVARFLRDYGDPMRSTLNRLAYLRRFDRDCFRFVLQEFLTGLPLESFDRLTKLSFIREAGKGWLALHGRIAEALVRMKDEAFAYETREGLFEHFDKRAIAESNLTVTDAHVEALAEAQAIRHEMPDFEEGYVTWLFLRQQPIHGAARYAQCQGFCELALERLTPVLSPDHPEVATTLNNLAGLLQAQGRYDAALPLFQRALSIVEKAFGLDHPTVAGALNNQANLYEVQGRYGEALPLFERALGILEKTCGPDHRDVATTLNNLASLHRAQGRYEESLALYQRALRIDEGNLGPDHPDVATTLSNISALYRDLGRYQEAAPLLQRALNINKKALGPNHPRVAMALSGLADLLQIQGYRAEALPLHQRALEIRKAALSPDHPHVAETLESMANLHADEGRHEQALQLFEQALGISENALGSDHPTVAKKLNNVSNVYLVQKRYDKAKPLYERALGIAEKSHGPHHPNTALALGNLAGLHYAQGRYKVAQPLVERAFRILESAFRAGHPDLETVRANREALRRKLK